MIEELNIDKLYSQSSDWTLLDTRSPSEYEKGHAVYAQNLPLLNDEERAKVGTTYKQKGREKAILMGFDLTGPKWSSYIQKALKLAPQKKVIIYCARGGMRSGIMSWLLDLYGFEVKRLVGGYKTYRNWVLQQFEEEYPFLILGGLTGSHKTDILQDLKEKGEQIIDLEGMAQHLGSAFGSLNKLIQPSQEHFENLLAHQLFHLDKKKRIWIEDESRNIGKRTLPEHIFQQIRNSKLLKIKIPKEERIHFLVEEYARLDQEFLIECTHKIGKRLGPQHEKAAIAYLKDGELESFIKTVLIYYDKMYLRGLERRAASTIYELEIAYKDNPVCADEIIQYVNKEL